MGHTINDDGDNEPLLLNHDDNENADNSTDNKSDRSKISFSNFKYKKEIILLLFIYTLLIVNSFVYNLVLPNVFIDYVEYHFKNLSPVDQQSKASYYKSYSDSIPNIFMFLLAPVAGVLSDKYGRRPVLFTGGLLLVLDMVSCYVTIVTHNLWPFYIFHSLAGACNIAASAVLSYIADISDEEERPLLYTFTGVASGIGVVLGPIIFIGSNHTKYSNLPLFVSIGLTSFALFIILFLRESLTIAKETNRIKDQDSGTWNPFKAIKKVFSNGYVGFITILFLSVNYTAQDVLSTYYYYCELNFNWSSTMNSLFMGGLGICIIFWSALVIPQLLKKFSQRRLISLGFFISFVAHLGYSASSISKFKSFGQYIFMASGFLGGYVPNNLYLLQSVISQATPSNIQGTVISGIQACGSIAGFLGALAANDIYSFSISNKKFYYPGALYLINAGIVLLTFCGSIIVWRFYKDPNKKNNNQDQESKTIN